MAVMRNFVKVIFLLMIYVAFIFPTGSCSSKDNLKSKGPSAIEQAKVKIHNEKYAEAESILIDFLMLHPGHSRAKVILASVYIHRAGIRIEDYLNLEEVINSKPSETDVYLEKSYLELFSHSTDNEMKDLGEYLKRFNSLVLQINAWKDKLEKLPKLSDTQAQDLESAISILSSLSMKPSNKTSRLDEIENHDEIVTNGMILYRAALKIYFFKYLWEKGNFLPVKEKMICRSTLLNLKEKMTYLEKYIQDVFTDFAVGLPRSSEKTLEQSKTFAEKTDQLLLWMQNIDPQTQTLSELLENLPKVEGFECNF